MDLFVSVYILTNLMTGFGYIYLNFFVLPHLLGITNFGKFGAILLSTCSIFLHWFLVYYIFFIWSRDHFVNNIIVLPFALQCIAIWTFIFGIYKNGSRKTIEFLTNKEIDNAIKYIDVIKTKVDDAETRWHLEIATGELSESLSALSKIRQDQKNV